MIYQQKRVIDQNDRSPSSTEKAKIRCGMTVVLERKGNVLLTHWNVLQPVLQSNENSGVYFRIKDGM
jgi:hypothetical protein